MCLRPSIPPPHVTAFTFSTALRERPRPSIRCGRWIVLEAGTPSGIRLKTRSCQWSAHVLVEQHPHQRQRVIRGQVVGGSVSGDVKGRALQCVTSRMTQYGDAES